MHIYNLYCIIFEFESKRRDTITLLFGEAFNSVNIIVSYITIPAVCIHSYIVCFTHILHIYYTCSLHTFLYCMFYTYSTYILYLQSAYIPILYVLHIFYIYTGWHISLKPLHRKIFCDQDRHFPFYTRLVGNGYAIKL